MEKFNVKSAPNALRSREVLAGLSPVKEMWRGKKINALLYVFVGMGLMPSTGLVLAELKVPMPFPMLCLLWFPVTIFMIGYEQVLILQNHRNVFFDFISDYLEKDEKPLAFLGGRALALNTVDWLPDDFFHRSYFIFTTDRILIITFDASKIKSGSILDSIDSGVEEIVSGVYCCDYLDDGSCIFGGIITNLSANIAYTKVKLTPVDEKDYYPWAIENRGTRNGQLLKEIITRVKSIDSRA